MKKIVLVIIFLLAISFFWIFSHYKIIDINGRKFIAETALTAEKQAKGLGGRKNLGANRAMFFEFKRAGQYGFWMKDMNFDLDIIWILDDKIVYIAKNVSHKSLEVIKPEIEADKVLEINSGLSDEYGFKAGNRVKIY